MPGSSSPFSHRSPSQVPTHLHTLTSGVVKLTTQLPLFAQSPFSHGHPNTTFWRWAFTGLFSWSRSMPFSRFCGIQPGIKKINKINYTSIHSKYFPFSDWLEPDKFTITSCCWPNLERILSYWTNDVKGKARCKIIEPITSNWRQKCSPLQIIEPLTEKTWGRDCAIFGEQKNKRRNGETL